MINFGFFDEQLLHPKFNEMLVHVCENRQTCTVDFNTNLSRATQGDLDLWAGLDLDEIKISLDAVTPEILNIVRPEKSG